MTCLPVHCSVLLPQPNLIRKATACQHSFIPICADSSVVGMVINMVQIEIETGILQSINNIGKSVEILSEKIFPLELDSIEYISLVVEMENYFKISIPDSELDFSLFQSKSHVIDVIDKELKKEK